MIGAQNIYSLFIQSKSLFETLLPIQFYRDFQLAAVVATLL